MFNQSWKYQEWDLYEEPSFLDKLKVRIIQAVFIGLAVFALWVGCFFFLSFGVKYV